MDILGQWVAEHCEIGPDYELFSSNAYSNYRFWADDAGLKRWSHVVFGRKLSERFAKRRDAKGVIYTGVGLKGATVGAHPRSSKLWRCRLRRERLCRSCTV